MLCGQQPIYEKNKISGSDLIIQALKPTNQTIQMYTLAFKHTFKHFSQICKPFLRSHLPSKA